MEELETRDAANDGEQATGARGERRESGGLGACALKGRPMDSQAGPGSVRGATKREMGKLADYIGFRVGEFERSGGAIKESDWVAGEDMARLRAWAEWLPEGAHKARAQELVGQVEALEDNIEAGEELPCADLLVALVGGQVVGAGWADLEWGGEVYCINQLVSVGGAGAALVAGFARKAMKWGAQMRVEALLEGGSDAFYSRLGASDYVETNTDLPWHGPVAREGDPYAPVWDGDVVVKAMAWSDMALGELAGAEVAEMGLA